MPQAPRPFFPAGRPVGWTGKGSRRSAVLPLVSPRAGYGLDAPLRRPDFSKISERKIRDMVRNSVQLLRRHFQFGPKFRQDWISQCVQEYLPHDALRAKPRFLMMGRQMNDLSNQAQHAFVERPGNLIDHAGHRWRGMRELAGDHAEMPVR